MRRLVLAVFPALPVLAHAEEAPQVDAGLLKQITA